MSNSRLQTLVLDAAEYLVLKEEVMRCQYLATKLDTLINPKLEGAFEGSPSERIERQLIGLGILKPKHPTWSEVKGDFE